MNLIVFLNWQSLVLVIWINRCEQLTIFRYLVIVYTHQSCLGIFFIPIQYWTFQYRLPLNQNIKIICSQCFVDKHKRIQSATQIPIKYLKYVYTLLFSTLRPCLHIFGPSTVSISLLQTVQRRTCRVLIVILFFFYYFNYIFRVLKKKNCYYVKWMWCTVLSKMHSSGNEDRQ